MRIAIVLFFMLFASSSWAAEDPNKWHTSQIHSIYPMSNGTFAIRFKTESLDCPQVANPKNHYVKVGENSMTKEGADKIFALALSAAAMKLPISIHFNSSTTDCFINRAAVVYQ